MVLRADDNRAFAYAVAASLVLHGLLLLALRLPAPEERAPAGGKIAARLERPLPATASPVEKSAAPVRHERPILSRPPIVPQEARTVATPAKEQRAEGRTTELAAGVPSAIQASAAAAAPDAGSIARYRQQLIGVAVRYKQYPPEALQAGVEGAVSLRVDISPSGLAEVAVKASSGHEPLDAQAIAMFRSAAPQVPLPADLLGQAFGVEVRAIYSLKD